MVAAVPHRADGVDHVARGKQTGGSGFRVAGLAAAEQPALLEDRGAAGSVDRAVHAAAAAQRLVGRVDDRVHVLLGDVAANELDQALRQRPKIKPPRVKPSPNVPNAKPPIATPLRHGGQALPAPQRFALVCRQRAHRGAACAGRRRLASRGRGRRRSPSTARRPSHSLYSLLRRWLRASCTFRISTWARGTTPCRAWPGHSRRAGVSGARDRERRSDPSRPSEEHERAAKLLRALGLPRARGPGKSRHPVRVSRPASPIRGASSSGNGTRPSRCTPLRPRTSSASTRCGPGTTSRAASPATSSTAPPRSSGGQPPDPPSRGRRSTTS